MEIKVDGIVCDGCTSRVEDGLKNVSDVSNAHANLESGLVEVEVLVETQMDAVDKLEELCQCVEDLGFDAQPHL